MIDAVSNQISSFSKYSNVNDIQDLPRSQFSQNGVPEAVTQVPPNDKKSADTKEQKKPAVMDTVTLSEDEAKQVEELKTRDLEVRKHEQAHKAVAGRYSGGSASYEYQVGPDGKRYAVGGEVSIDLSKGRTPEETLQKASAVKAAALAPAEPSAQDRKVAAMAAQMEKEAREALSLKHQQKAEEASAGIESEERSPSTVETAPPLPKNLTDDTARRVDISSSKPDIPEKSTISTGNAAKPKTSEAPPSPLDMPEPERDRRTTNAMQLQIADRNPSIEKFLPNPASVSKIYQENTPSSLSGVDATTSSMVMLSMAI